jgi:hypothetical protein
LIAGGFTLGTTLAVFTTAAQPTGARHGKKVNEAASSHAPQKYVRSDTTYSALPDPVFIRSTYPVLPDISTDCYRVKGMCSSVNGMAFANTPDRRIVAGNAAIGVIGGKAARRELPVSAGASRLSTSRPSSNTLPIAVSQADKVNKSNPVS